MCPELQSGGCKAQIQVYLVADLYLSPNTILHSDICVYGFVSCLLFTDLLLSLPTLGYKGLEGSNYFVLHCMSLFRHTPKNGTINPVDK